MHTHIPSPRMTSTPQHDDGRRHPPHTPTPTNLHPFHPPQHDDDGRRWCSASSTPGACGPSPRSRCPVGVGGVDVCVSVCECVCGDGWMDGRVDGWTNTCLISSKLHTTTTPDAISINVPPLPHHKSIHMTTPPPDANASTELATACHDGVVRVFTRDARKYAGEEVRCVFFLMFVCLSVFVLHFLKYLVCLSVCLFVCLFVCSSRIVTDPSVCPSTNTQGRGCFSFFLCVCRLVFFMFFCIFILFFVVKKRIITPTNRKTGARRLCPGRAGGGGQAAAGRGGAQCGGGGEVRVRESVCRGVGCVCVRSPLTNTTTTTTPTTPQPPSPPLSHH